MKKIGKGFYYNVYDIGSGRVRKIPRSQISQFLQLFQWYFLRPKLLVKELLKAPYSKIKTEEQYTISQKVVSTAPQYFGGIVFYGQEYEQDIAIRLGDLIETISKEQFIDYCKEYVRVVQELWKLGIGEKIFNFTINAGVVSSGAVVLLDTNEFTFEKAEIESKIISQRPFQSSSFKRLPEPLKSPVREIFEREFTLEKLNQFWGKEIA